MTRPYKLFSWGHPELGSDIGSASSCSEILVGLLRTWGQGVPKLCWEGWFSGKKKSTTITFLGPETARWGGGLRCEGVVVEKFVPFLESLSSLGFRREESGMSREFCRNVPPDPWGCSKSWCKKTVCAHFSFLGLRFSRFGRKEGRNRWGGRRGKMRRKGR